MTDAELDREIAAALAVNPSPEFLAGVRARLADQPRPSWSLLHWGAGLAAAVALVVTAVAISWQDGSTPPAIQPPVATTPGAVQAGLPTGDRMVPERVAGPRTAPRRGKSVSTPALAAGPVAGAEIIIAADEAAAFRRLVSAARVRQPLFAPLPERPTAIVALQPSIEISIAPITFEPLEPVTSAEGERP